MTYFPHQIHGIQWMLERETEGTPVYGEKGTVYGGFQCDDMGLGKTIQTVATICHNPQPNTLIVVPVAMVETWAETCRRAGLQVWVVSGKVGASQWVSNRVSDCDYVSNRVSGSKSATKGKVYLTNYEKIPSRPSLFTRSWDRIVVDEAHKLRNPYAEISYAMRRLQARIRWVLSGTPLVNSQRDVTSLAIFLGIPFEAGYHWSIAMQKMIPRMMLHRSLDELRYRGVEGAPPLPNVYDCVLPFDTQAEEDFYHSVQQTVENELQRNSRHHGALSNAMKFVLLMRLRQISVHPQTYLLAMQRATGEPADWHAPSTKMQKVAEIIRADQEAEEKGGRDAVEASREDGGAHKYLIFCQFHDEMNLFQEFLVMEGLVRPESVLLYHGGMTAAQRKEVLITSKASQETTVLLLQLQAGGVGLNLQEYDRIIFMSPWWTAALMDQAMARAVRMGQQEVVRVYHLRLAAERENSLNIDQMVHGKAEEKRGMLEDLFEWCAKEAPESVRMEPLESKDAE